MTNSILSIGIDVGTTSTHFVISRLHFANTAAFQQAPRLKIQKKEIVYQSRVYFTPLSQDGSIDHSAIAEIISNEYVLADVTKAEIDAGAVIVTGESAKIRNAELVSHSIADFAGEFVVASAGPNLESILAARGSGAIAHSLGSGKRIFNVDIGGGTVNAAVVASGEVVDTACLGIGGRCMRFSDTGVLLAATESAIQLFDAVSHKNLKSQIGTTISVEDLMQMARTVASEITRFLFEHDYRSNTLMLTPSLRHNTSFDELWITGGVAELLEDKIADSLVLGELLPFGDLGLVLAKELRIQLSERRVNYFIPPTPIRSTVIGAGMHSLQLSGSTIDAQQFELPIKNVPLIRIDWNKDIKDSQHALSELVTQRLRVLDLDWTKTVVALFVQRLPNTEYSTIKECAAVLAAVSQDLKVRSPLIVITSSDIAAALGLLLRKLLEHDRIVVIDGVDSAEGDYLDIGRPIVHSQQGAHSFALPVVIKSLVFGS